MNALMPLNWDFRIKSRIAIQSYPCKSKLIVDLIY